MYAYTDFDRQVGRARAAQYRDQLARHLGGELGEEEFRPLRLQNGWYVQRHAPMLRVAVPYGELSSRQLRQLGRIARDFDLQDAGTLQERGGFGHRVLLLTQENFCASSKTLGSGFAMTHSNDAINCRNPLCLIEQKREETHRGAFSAELDIPVRTKSEKKQCAQGGAE